MYQSQWYMALSRRLNAMTSDWKTFWLQLHQSLWTAF